MGHRAGQPGCRLRSGDAMTPLVVNVHWDPDAKVWWAESDDVPGLVSEAETFERIVENVIALIPDLLELNGAASKGEIPVCFMADRVEKLRLEVA
jgi:predicted RNase H-like HicB family nuclease